MKRISLSVFWKIRKVVQNNLVPHYWNPHIFSLECFSPHAMVERRGLYALFYKTYPGCCQTGLLPTKLIYTDSPQVLCLKIEFPSLIVMKAIINFHFLYSINIYASHLSMNKTVKIV